MARKNLLEGLIGQGIRPAGLGTGEGIGERAQPSPQDKLSRYRKGAIGAVGQSIADLKSRAIAEIDPFTIDQGGVVDRLDDEDSDHNALVASLRAYGQQVPVLVRPHPTKPGRYQIVYGRRRVKALRDLNLPVKAMIRDLDDRQLVIAQGQENTARKDLTFIEKVNFARQMRDAGYERKIICDALNVDKTLVSRMLSVADAIPVDLIEAIGSAPSVGRNRWLALVELMNDSGITMGEAVSLVHFASAKTSDDRFQALMKALTLPLRRDAAAEDETTILRTRAGQDIGRMTRKAGKLTVTIPLERADGFDKWLAENFDRIHADWLASRSEPVEDQIETQSRDQAQFTQHQKP